MGVLKSVKSLWILLFFDNNIVIQVITQKHLGVCGGTKLDFQDFWIFKGIFSKVNKTTGRSHLLTICKSFIRPHLDYGDVIYEQTYNTTFHQNLKSI